jgi:predicted ArsR family transcriptional regulator
VDAPAEQSLLGQPTRARLFAVLQELRRAATTEELARAVDMHANGVRRHLERMHEGGLLERHRSRHGRGRPRDEWSIAPKASPDGGPPRGYADVARWLARAIPAGPGRLRQVEGTGREVGRDLVTGPTDDLAAAFRQTFSALGFQPEVEDSDGGAITAKLCNCPYRDSVRENPEVICRLHRGVTVGVLETLDPDARVVRFEPHDPDRAGCMVEIVRGGRKQEAGIRDS